MAQSKKFKQIRIAYMRGIKTAAEVWECVPDDITAEEATIICGPRPE